MRRVPLAHFLLGLALFYPAAVHAKKAADEADPESPASVQKTANSDAERRTRIRADLRELLNAKGRNYLFVRERLESTPDESADAFLELWTAQATGLVRLSDDEVGRLTEVWLRIAPDKAAPMIAQQLRSRWAAIHENTHVDCEPGIESGGIWCARLSKLGAAGAAAFLQIAADANLSVGPRKTAIEQLIEISPPDWLGAIASRSLRTPGDDELQATLHRALVRRTHKDAIAQAQVLNTIDSVYLDPNSDARLRTRSLILRQHVAGSLDEQQIALLLTRSEDERSNPAERIASLRILLTFAPTANPSLVSRLDSHWQASKNSEIDTRILLELLRGLPEDATANFLSSHDVREHPHPQLQALAWARKTLPANPRARASQFRVALASPWPAVQIAALQRVDRDCTNALLRRMDKIAGPESRGGSEHRVVRREAIDALARCGGRFAERRLLRIADSDAIGSDARGHALRRYIEHTPDDRRSAKNVEIIVGRAPNELGRAALFDALGRLTTPPTYVYDVLCDWALSQNPEIRRTSARNAQRALTRLGMSSTCGDKS